MTPIHNSDDVDARLELLDELHQLDAICRTFIARRLPLRTLTRQEKCDFYTLRNALSGIRSCLGMPGLLSLVERLEVLDGEEQGGDDALEAVVVDIPDTFKPRNTPCVTDSEPPPSAS